MFSRQQKGFTIIELLIVVSLISVLAAIGYTQMSVLLPRYRTYQAAKQFAQNVQKIRQEAATDGIEHRIALVDYDPAYLDRTSPTVGEYYIESGNRESRSGSWEYLPTDALQDKTDDETGEGMVNIAETIPGVSIVPWDALTGPTGGEVSNADCIVVSPRGWLTNPNEDFNGEGYIEVEFINKPALRRGAVEIYQVKLSRSGMVRIDYNDALYESVIEYGKGIDDSSRSASTSSSSGGGDDGGDGRGDGYGGDRGDPDDMGRF